MKKFLSALLLCLLSTTSLASFVRIDFGGTDYGGVSTFNGASDDLGFKHGDQFSGYVVVDVSIPDQRLDDASLGFFPLAVREYQFGPVWHGPTHLNYSLFHVDTDYNVIGFYFNSIVNGVSDVFQVSLELKPGIITSDTYDLLSLRYSDIVSGTQQSGNAAFLFQRSFLGNPVQPSTAVYSGYINSLLVYSVPEPGSVILILTGITLLSRRVASTDS